MMILLGHRGSTLALGGDYWRWVKNTVWLGPPPWVVWELFDEYSARVGAVGDDVEAGGEVTGIMAY